MRIKGLVKVSHQVREQLKVGIPANEVTQFKQFVRDTLKTVKRLCADARLAPDQLPTPSRQAYRFLKQLNLSQLPIAKQSNHSPIQKTIRIGNIRSQQQSIQREIAILAQSSNLDSAQGRKLVKTLQRTVSQIEHLCNQQQITLVQLTGPSRQIYAWMKFLLEGQNLQLHLQATQQVYQLVTEVVNSTQLGGSQQLLHHVSLDTLSIEFTNLSGLYRHQHNPKHARLQINEGFITASPQVLRAIVQSMLLGKSTATTAALKTFSLSEDFGEVLLAMDLLVGSITENAQGKAYDLNHVFDLVNREYFRGQMAKPQLAWSQVFTQRKFGHYEPARDRLVISLTLDQQRIPRYVVEFVMYHELLHKHHGERWSNGRCLVHTPQFRRDECNFKHYQSAQQWLERLAKH